MFNFCNRDVVNSSEKDKKDKGKLSEEVKTFLGIEDLSFEYFGKLLTIVIVGLVICAAVFLTIILLITKGDITSSTNYAAIIINIVVAAFGFVAIFVSVQSDKDTKVYEYIEDYNFHFLTSKEFIKVERKLETCYQKYKTLAVDGLLFEKDLKTYRDFCDKVFGTEDCKYNGFETTNCSRIDESGCISENYQQLINYLVYLESFVILLNDKKIKISKIDNLFGYRYFIAMNNPVMQENELFLEAEYYKGCIDIYEAWKKERKNKIPMETFDFTERMKQYASLTNTVTGREK